MTHHLAHFFLFVRRGSPAFLAVLLCTAWACWEVPSALAQGGGQPAAGVPEDDPFADELNPFGPGAEKRPQNSVGPGVDRPAERAGVPSGRSQQPELPVPFPETTVPGDPARRTDRSKTESRPGADSGPRRDRMGGRDTWEPTPAEQLLTEADKLDRAGNLEAAREKLREVIRLDPRLTLGYLALGVTSRRLGDFEGCVDACSKGLAIDPQDSELYLRRGIAWFYLGLHGIALEDFEDAAGIAYDDPRPELWRGLTLMELGRPLEAINAYASSIRRDRGFMLAYLNRGLAYLKTGEPRKAEYDFNQAIRHDPADVRAWFNRGVAQAAQGKHAEAVSSYSEALKRDPQHDGSRRNIESSRRMMASSRPVAATP